MPNEERIEFSVIEQAERIDNMLKAQDKEIEKRTKRLKRAFKDLGKVAKKLSEWTKES